MLTSTQSLKQTILSTPANATANNLSLENLGFGSKSKSTTPSGAIHQTIVKGSEMRKNEIFVDVIEKLTVAYNFDGFILHSEINGTIKLKNFLTGQPLLKLALNDDLNVDDCNFHANVDVIIIFLHSLALTI